LELGDASAAGAGQQLGENNIEAIGRLLYGKYIVLFEIAGIILLVAMIGAIVLTHREPKPGARGRQDIGKQISRRPDEATVMKQPTIGEGVEL
ncbi:MAG: NADH-quinone oxidoreductase subunit J, partial [Pseudomonadota bacterium]